jgi:hypothetical protein
MREIALGDTTTNGDIVPIQLKESYHVSIN